MTDLIGLTKTLESGRTLLGTGWKTVESFDDIDDDEYEEDEEEYVVMDLGTAMDGRTLQTEAAYQLIGMDTSMPFLKVGEHVFQGKVTGLIGDEVLFDVIRGGEDAQNVHYTPIHTTRKRIEFRGITLAPRPTYRGPAADPVVVIEDVPIPGEEPLPMDVDEEEAPLEAVKPETSPEVAQAALAAAPAAPAPQPEAGLSRRGKGKPRRGRPIGVAARAAIEVRTLADIADIHFAVTIAKDATKELIDAVSEARGNKPYTPGQRLSRAQEERLIRRRPGTGAGSRGGKAGRGGARLGQPVPGRKRGPKGGPGVDSSGVGMADDFIGGIEGGGDGVGEGSGWAGYDDGDEYEEDGEGDGEGEGGEAHDAEDGAEGEDGDHE
ncbi:uncharacterized protein LOC62_01G000446 [Vanrija pseudolonga]|uniref:Transcription factor TFIIIC triple barrel domain-containing protein n=1 Tax=Vanrija pseudolonga TaxID=143232 RepID=A0AAF0Y3B7_9TREE|nr:hypothetical protein LOC62_01G000446 [Vanrija pseudolonga]